MTRAETLTRLLKNLSSTTPNVEAAAVVDNDGLMIASSLPADVSDDAVAAMSAALLGMSERAAQELKRGNLELIMLRGSEGFTILARAGADGVLAVLARSEAKLGLIFLDITRTAKEVARVLS